MNSQHHILHIRNGTAERSWRTLIEMSRCLLLEANLPKFLWTYAMMCSVYIRNRCYNNRLGMTPVEALTGKKPNLSNMHVFGSRCFAYEQEKSKLDPRATEGVFIGYDKNSPAFLIYFPTTRSVRKVRCVRFTDVVPINDDNVHIPFENSVNVPETSKKGK